ncbi:hypothetical protein CH63R_10489 [Colletotrichum higginsianum IMI 349063]|uniref:Uncharacterized protein n=1 Tax=Colletotrichum higginsianum (strain IMI 349063) TaxID=759273 RepID=A0A1B7Y2Y4_COLHI|nr:uncharacterized protein CH63R_10489 [Colletotrichum higginsianum IMI 349063]OBR06369.1 hypothetical protein CH63R_10489 [Colletotrichum higginsianum IMI 349063]
MKDAFDPSSALKTSCTTAGAKSDYVCRLYPSILELWALVLSQETWALRTPPQSIKFSHSRRTLSAEDLEDLELWPTTYSHHEAPCGEKASLDTYIASISDQDKWKWVRLILSDQRDRFYVWKSSFSNEELAQITGGKSSRLGNSLLESLVNIAESLVMSLDSGPPSSRLHENATKLTELVKEGKRHLKDFGRVANDSLCSTKVTLGYLQLEGDGLIEIMSDEIQQLQRLSYSARLELEFGTA